MPRPNLDPVRPASATRTAAAGDLRAIERVVEAPPRHWVGDGFHVAGYAGAIPDAARRLDPFLLLDYHAPEVYPPSDRPRGVGVHPHRGFETVTIAWEGSVAHHDSTGAGGVIGPGDVQWMTAASGILHKEYHEEAFARRGGTFHMAQLWVNLPRAHKLDAPRYQPLTADRIPIVELPGGAGTVRVIAGEHGGVRGPALTFSPINVLDARLRAGGAMTLAFPAGHHTAVLVMAGSVTVNGARAAGTGAFILFGDAGSRIELTAAADAHLLVLDGEPLREPIVQYGPFVMSTQREILQAFADFQAGAFGELDD
ncbi:MAG TPA: pirin family protein [Kofleriaceae bacterium]|nr:pirin family protein [Kofleriaceae bacterium]